MPGKDEYTRFRVDLFDFFQNIKATHSRHEQVSDHQVVELCRTKFSESSFSTFCRFDVKCILFQIISKRFENRSLIIDQQNHRVWAQLADGVVEIDEPNPWDRIARAAEIIKA